MTDPEDSKKRWDFSTATLILANCAPIAGVLFFHWQVFPLVLLYWLENVIVGVFNVLRMLVANPKDPIVWGGKLFLIPFFCVHFGMFCFIHGVFVFAWFHGGPEVLKGGMSPIPLVLPAIRETGIGFGVASLILSHGISFVTNYIHGGEYRRTALSTLMTRPYARIMVLHFVILGGAVPILFFHSPVPGLLLLVALKTGVDVVAHRKERLKLADPGTAAILKPKPAA